MRVRRASRGRSGSAPGHVPAPLVRSAHVPRSPPGLARTELRRAAPRWPCPWPPRCPRSVPGARAGTTTGRASSGPGRTHAANCDAVTKARATTPISTGRRRVEIETSARNAAPEASADAVEAITTVMATASGNRRRHRSAVRQPKATSGSPMTNHAPVSSVRPRSNTPMDSQSGIPTAAAAPSRHVCCHHPSRGATSVFTQPLSRSRAPGESDPGMMRPRPESNHRPASGRRRGEPQG